MNSLTSSPLPFIISIKNQPTPKITKESVNSSKCFIVPTSLNLFIKTNIPTVKPKMSKPTGPFVKTAKPSAARVIGKKQCIINCNENK